MIITVIYSVYFKEEVANKAPWSNAVWGWTLSLSQCVVILFAPLIGAIADLKACKKSFLMITTVVCSVATCALFFVGSGEVVLAVTLVAIAYIAFSMSENICSGFLPEISTPETAGKISGYGWSFGYFGGLISLVLALVIYQSGEGRTPWTFIMTGVFFMAAALPTLILLKERAIPQSLPPGRNLWTASWRENAESLRRLRSGGALGKFFIALTLFTTGLSAVIAFASIYAAEVVGMKKNEIIGLFVVLQLAGAAGAYGFGFLQDRKGPKYSLVISLCLWIAVCVWAALCRTKVEFYIIGALAGVAMGSLQSAGRAVVATFTPEGKSGEYFGYWGFFTKLAAVIGPPVFGMAATFFGERIAIFVNAGFFIAGLVVLLPLAIDRRKSTTPPAGA
ncbi:MFS transporter [Luteolibacter sp. SL250]|uniref:MFS transporter n=1 Tax=Luteolibacter sp. SL250 TaxID=2995170 RepID=UPI002D1E4788|nr:MFS transporter [Luteolibacter sp. SL250]